MSRMAVDCSTLVTPFNQVAVECRSHLFSFRSQFRASFFIQVFAVAAPAGTDFVIVECALSPSQNILDVFRISQKIKAKLSFKYYLVYVSKC